MTHDMKQNIKMKNMVFTERKQHSVVMADFFVQPDLKSGCKEYKDLQSDKRIANADIQSERIANPLERGGGNTILSSRRLRSLLLLLLMLTVGTTTSWGQEDFSGVWYIANETNHDEANISTHWYLVPAKDPKQPHFADAYFHNEFCNKSGKGDYTGDNYGDPEKPFLTTYQTNQDLNSIWIVVSTGDGYYNIIHAKTGSYIVYEPPYKDAINRKSMHLDSTPTGDNAKFAITGSLSGSINIRPKSVTSGNRFFNPAVGDGNYPRYYGTGDYFHAGMIGLYSASNDKSQWYFEKAKLPAPTIEYDYENDKFVISYNKIPAGFQILYTIDDSEPTIGGSTTQEYTNESVITLEALGFNPLKAVVVRYGLILTETAIIRKPSNPIITPTPGDCENTVTITADEGTNIYYTIDGIDPTNSSTHYTGPFVVNEDATIKAIAYSRNLSSGITTNNYNPNYSVKPTIITTYQSGVTVTISGTGTIYYTTNGDEPNTDSTPYIDPFTLTGSSGDVITIKAVAKNGNKELSCVAKKTVTMGYFINDLTSLENISSHLNELCIVTSDIDASGLSESISNFTGIFDGGYYTISKLRKPLFSTTSGAVIKNVMLKDVQISQSGSVGAITSVANGYTRIYNCGILPNSNKFENETSDISSSDSYCGGLVGELNDDSRVVNCFSYAKITGGTVKAGIVGYNQTASNTSKTDSDTKYGNLKTMVVNCMFYGDITGTTGEVYPVYGGSKILNNSEYGINNYNYYRAEASLMPTDYNCSWPALEENLTRFEYYRSLLNANRELCGWWVKSDVAPSTMSTADVQAIEKDASLMAKWVLDPAIAPYPILKPAGKYPSVINIDPIRRTDPDSKAWVTRDASDNDIQTNSAPDIRGETLGSISVSINAGSHHSGSASRSIPITAMDLDNNDFCYGKIQLPYYNDVFGNPEGTNWSEKYGDNYTNMVVTGWDITTSGGTTGTFSDDPITGYNFADRNCTAKDTHRTFAQGAYYYVPYDVTSITITAHWANAYYLSNTDANYERVYFSDGSNNKISAGKPFAPAGTRSFGSGEFGGQTINNGTITDILKDNNTDKQNSVYDCAIVLVGNYQYRSNTENIADDNKKPFTLMTVDLDFDNEPDYCFEWQFGGGDQGVTRAWINPVRFDFLPIVELGIAMKEDNSKYLFSIGKVTPYGHFEVTETALIHMGQFEYDDQKRTNTGPVILNNGIYDQICRGSESSNNQHVNYFILGGHVKMPSFTPGAHVRKNVNSRHCAVNVLGGEFEYFYLSGNYRDDPTNEGNPHCYIDGGKLDFVASGAKEQIVGDVVWKIDHAYIGEFYGGGINANKPVKGNISTTINRSKVTKFCGGPQFGDMESGKTVMTFATGTTFNVFYGAGNGGTCYSQYDQSDNTTGSGNSYTPNNYGWEASGGGKLTNYTPLTYRSTNPIGYHAKYELEMINSSAGTMNNAVCRTYMYSAQFATTNTGAVTSTLTDCTVETNFFGGGLLGGVTGNITSTLTGNTVVVGNVYGGGYGIADLTVDVLPKGNTESTKYTAPTRDENTSVITAPEYPTPTTYTWTHNTTFGDTTLSTSSPAILNPNGDGKNYLYTAISLDNLGTVTGNVTLNIEGNTEIGGNVFGGGDEGVVQGSTEVNIKQ